MTSPTADRRQGLVGNTPIKAPVVVAATANITLAGEQTIDGVAVLAVNAAGVPDRVLVTAQTSSIDNGIYDVNTGAWTRSLDCNKTYDLAQGSMVSVTQGALKSGYYKVTTANPITIGTSALTWTRLLNAPDDLTAASLEAQHWADYTGGDVPGYAGHRSAKSWAEENLTGVTYGGSSKDWAQSASKPDGTNESAKTYAAAAAASRAAVDARIYPGTYAVAPTTRPTGAAIQAGDVFFNTSGQALEYQSGVWGLVVGPSTADLANSADPTKGSALVGHRGESLAAHLANARPNLSKFWRGNSVSGRKVFMVGDSRFTEANTAALYAELRKFTTAGDLLGGATIVDFGSNGNTLANFVNDPVGGGAAGKAYNDLKAAATASDLIAVNYGINDIRLGATSTAQLEALFETLYRNIAIDIGCDVVHFAGNPLTQDDTAGNHYVKTAGGVVVDQGTNGNGAVAQTYTQILIDTANYFKNRYRNVAVLDSFATCFGYLSPLTAAGSGWANDQLHPNSAIGMLSEAHAIAAFAAPPTQVPVLRTLGSPADAFSKERSNAAIAANPTSPWLIYPRVVEDTDFFDPLFQARYATKDSVSITLEGWGGYVTQVQAGDLVHFFDSDEVWTVPPLTFRTNIGATQLRWGFGAGTGPATGGTVAGSMVQVYRPKNKADNTLRGYLADRANYNVWKCTVANGNTNFFILSSFDYADIPAARRTLKAGDLVYVPGVGTITVTAVGNTISGSNLQINQTGNFTAYNGLQGWVISTRPPETNTKPFAPVTLSSKGALVAGTLLDSIVASRPGFINDLRGNLSTAGAGGNTVVQIRVGGVVKGTLTFPSATNAGTASWSSGSDFSYRPGEVVDAFCLSITGTPADLAVSLDIA